MSTASQARSQAQVYLDVNRPKEAIRVLHSSLATDPEDAAALRLLGQAELAAELGPQGATDAIAAVQHSLALEPESAHAWRILSAAYGRLKWHSQSREAARNAQRLEPNQWQSYTSIANADASARYITAETTTAVQTALQLAPNNPDVHFAAARVATVQGKTRLAQEHYGRTLSLNPDHAAARNNLALIRMKRGDAGTAAASFVGLLAQDPNSELALYNLRIVAQRALQPIDIVLWITILIVSGTVGGGFTSSNLADGNENLVARIVAAAIATGFVAGYVLWVRAKAGTHFGRFVRSIPRTDKFLTGWATVLVLCILGLITATFVPIEVVKVLYEAEVFVMIVVILSAFGVARLRKRPGT